MLQQSARTLSRIFAADYWRLDVFLADGAPPHCVAFVLKQCPLLSFHENCAAPAAAPSHAASVGCADAVPARTALYRGTTVQPAPSDSRDSGTPPNVPAIVKNTIMLSTYGRKRFG